MVKNYKTKTSELTISITSYICTTANRAISVPNHIIKQPILTKENMK